MLRRYQNIFRSRWKALGWAAGVLLTAYCSVPAADAPPAGKADMAPPAHVNPWAIDPPAAR